MRNQIIIQSSENKEDKLTVTFFDHTDRNYIKLKNGAGSLLCTFNGDQIIELAEEIIKKYK